MSDHPKHDPDAPMPDLPPLNPDVQADAYTERVRQRRTDERGRTDIHCLRCNSIMILCTVGSQTGGRVRFYALRQRLFGGRYSEAFALVCELCGYSETRAINPEQLYSGSR